MAGDDLVAQLRRLFVVRQCLTACQPVAERCRNEAVLDRTQVLGGDRTRRLRPIGSRRPGIIYQEVTDEERLQLGQVALVGDPGVVDPVRVFRGLLAAPVVGASSA